MSDAVSDVVVNSPLPPVRADVSVFAKMGSVRSVRLANSDRARAGGGGRGGVSGIGPDVPTSVAVHQLDARPHAVPNADTAVNVYMNSRTSLRQDVLAKEERRRFPSSNSRGIGGGERARRPGWDEEEEGEDVQPPPRRPSVALDPDADRATRATALMRGLAPYRATSHSRMRGVKPSSPASHLSPNKGIVFF